MKHLVTLIYAILLSAISFSQIYEPEGLNLPGSWNNWTNPPDTSTPFLASATQVPGGQVHLVAGLAQRIYQTVFNTTDTGDLAPGSYTFLFTSGPTNDPWRNKWADVNVSINLVQTYTYYNNYGGTDNSITLNPNKWYIVNWKDIGYQSTEAIFMEISGPPANITFVKADTTNITDKDSVKVTIATDIIPASDQYFYLRYTTDFWNTSQLKLFTFNQDTAVAYIPPQPAGTRVDFYIFSSSTIFPQDNFDLLTITFANNNGQNWNYYVKTSPSDTTTTDTTSTTTDSTTTQFDTICNWQFLTVTPIPPLPTENSGVELYFNATLGNGALANYTGDIYAHTGVITNKSPDDNYWLYVVSNWGENLPQLKFERLATNLYRLKIPNIREFYGITDSTEHVRYIAMVIRSADPISPDNPNEFIVAREADGSDIFIPVYQPNDVVVKILHPNQNSYLFKSGDRITICAKGLNTDSLVLIIDSKIIVAEAVDSISYIVVADSLGVGNHLAIVKGQSSGKEVYDTVKFLVLPDVVYEPLPDGVGKGVNVINDSTVVFVLWDPAKKKNYAFVIGDFNNWQPDANFYMKRTPDSSYFWLEVSGLNPNEKYAYQYLIDGTLRLADPYSREISDPWNDQYIDSERYPDLKPYPAGKTYGIVSVFRINEPQYQWQVTNFVPQALNENQPNLVVYELLVRDFVETSTFDEVINKLDYLQRLGVNAIEIMPVNEFEGNISWGYNPDFYFAVDKYYGGNNEFKRFVDECHKRGIAVILDIALNHSFGLSPLVQMYWDSKNNQPSADNPWYNQIAPHPLSPGYDFNHQSTYTKEFVKEVLKYWLTEFKIDGFRFDLSKGFTQNQSSDLTSWSAYDASRIAILKEYYDFIKSINPNAYVVLEHFADNSEESELAAYGFLLWQNMNYNFAQALMGYWDGSDWSWAYYQNRNFIYPNNLVFMESHDEERLMYKALNYGNSYQDYNVKDLNTALERSKALALMFFTIPGPKMLWQFQELGYEISINDCGNGTISEDCRTAPKPPHWDYIYDDNRLALYNFYRKIIHLKTQYPIFKTTDFSIGGTGLARIHWLSSDTANLMAIANLGVAPQTITIYPQHTGTWYDIFTDQTIEFNASSVDITLQPGEYHLYSDTKLQLPPDYHAYTTNLTQKLYLYPNPAQNSLTIESPQNGLIEIFDLTGKKISSKPIYKGRNEINITNLRQGCYIIRIKTDSKIYTQKFIKL